MKKEKINFLKKTLTYGFGLFVLLNIIFVNWGYWGAATGAEGILFWGMQIITQSPEPLGPGEQPITGYYENTGFGFPFLVETYVDTISIKILKVFGNLLACIVLSGIYNYYKLKKIKPLGGKLSRL